MRLAALIVYLGALFASAIVQARRLFPHLARWYVLVPSVATMFALFAVSYSTVSYLRGTGLPIPSLMTAAPVLGEDQVLRWDVPAESAASDTKFQVQSSAEPDFSNPDTKIVGDAMFLLRADRNETRYWRVRAVDFDRSTPGRRRYGTWSKPIKVAQYRNVIDKIRLTRRFTVAMENEFDRSIFRWYEQAGDNAATSSGAGQEVTYEGVEIDLAYAIADEICRAHLEGQRDEVSRNLMTCRPSRPDQRTKARADVCKKKNCVEIEMRIAALSFDSVMRSVGQGQADMAISSITFKPERERIYNILFGKASYEITGFGLVSRAPDAGQARSGGASLPFLGGKVAVQDGTTSYDCMKWLQATLGEASNDLPFELVPYNRNVVALNSLAHGTSGFGFVVTDEAFAVGWQKLEVEGHVVVDPLLPMFAPHKNARMPEYCAGQHYRIAVRAGEDGLQQLADRVVRNMQESGQLEKLKISARERFNQHAAAAQKKGTPPKSPGTGSVP